MKREVWLGLLALVLLSGIFSYFARMQSRGDSSAEDLAWLKSNFNLSSEQMHRIEKLHHDYLPRCMEMCSRVRQANLDLQSMIEQGNASRADIQSAVNQVEKVKSECSVAMIEHVHQIAATMPPGEGARYLREIAPLLSYSSAHEHAMAGHAGK